jgi:hypothetical protein
MRCLRARRPGRGGFSVIEMVVASYMTALLAAIVGAVWTAFCFPALDVAARCQLTQEANLASASLARDCGGFLNTPDGRTLTLSDFRYNGCEFTPSGEFHVNFLVPQDYQARGAPCVIVYKLNAESPTTYQLIRSVGTDGPWTIVASGLTSFTQAPPVDGDPGPAVLMTFRSHGRKSRPDSPNMDLVASYILVTPAADPP